MAINFENLLPFLSSHPSSPHPLTNQQYTWRITSALPTSWAVEKTQTQLGKSYSTQQPPGKHDDYWADFFNVCSNLSLKHIFLFVLLLSIGIFVLSSCKLTLKKIARGVFLLPSTSFRLSGCPILVESLHDFLSSIKDRPCLYLDRRTVSNFFFFFLVFIIVCYRDI